MTDNIKISLMMRFVLVAILGSILGCTDSFEEMNTNKHEATEETMTFDNLKTGAFFSQMQRSVVLFDDGTNLSSDYQVAQGLTADIYSGYLAPTGTWYAGVHNGSYYFITGWIEKTFTNGFSRIMPAWRAIVDIATEQELPEVTALATVIKVMAMHRVADSYGPLPYLNYGDGTLQNDYDSLEDIYHSFFSELGDAIDQLTDFVNGNPGAPLLQKYDLVYEGDVTRWVKFANTLRMRLALRVADADPGLARAEAEKSALHPMGMVDTPNERAYLRRSSNLLYYHPLYDIAYNFNEGEVRMGATMDAYMNGYNDPRLPAYFRPAQADGSFHGVRTGITTSVWSRYVGPNISNINVDNSTTSIVWMTAAESHFLRAEGALRGWNMGGTAEEFYEKGIETSFEENNVTGAENYIANNSRTPIAFTDNAEGSNFNAPAPSNITIAWEESDNFEEKLERIITQKWIALYPDGPEGWAEFRRTGYPKLLPVVTNNSNGTIDTSIQVRRIPFPQSEYNNNLVGVQAGVALLNGQDHGGTRLWWDKD